MDLYVVKDENYQLVVRAKSWEEAKQKAINWSKNKISLDTLLLEAFICDNDEVIE